jgi:hypothetical protein
MKQYRRKEDDQLAMGKNVRILWLREGGIVKISSTIRCERDDPDFMCVYVHDTSFRT